MPQGPGSPLLVLASHCCLGLVGGPFLFSQPDFSYKPSSCNPTPANLRLCRGIEDHNMWLPDLLGHETRKEVREQAGAWIPLVMQQCHPHTKKSLCSLFTPVCLEDLDETIHRATRSVQVKDGCTPVMPAFCFPGPTSFSAIFYHGTMTSAFPSLAVTTSCWPLRKLQGMSLFAPNQQEEATEERPSSHPVSIKRKGRNVGISILPPTPPYNPAHRPPTS